MSSGPKLSVVVASYDRPKLLPSLIDDLERQTLDADDFELILVDDGSKTPVASVLAGRSPPFALTIIGQENTGQAAARHRGILEAHHEIIVVADDDMRLPPAFLEAHRCAHRRGHSVVLGHIRPAGSLREMPLFERFHALQLDKQVGAFRRGARVEGTHLCTGNVSFRREDYLAVGGFDSELVRSEDRELGVRLESYGARLVFDEAAYTIHASDHTDLAVWRRRAFLYGVCDSQISDKHRHLPRVNPWSYLFRVNPLSRPLLLLSTAVPGLGEALSSLAFAASSWCDRRGFEALALRGTTLVYGLEYFRGMRAHSGSLASSARRLLEFSIRSLTAAR